MDYIISGGRRLAGEISVYGAKNCVLPLLGASVLTDGELILHNCPKISDVENMLSMLRAMGKNAYWRDNSIVISGTLTSTRAPESLAKLLRGSALILGGTLSRYGEIDLPLPGGCAIGKRPMDIHLAGLEKMGVEIDAENNLLICRGKPSATEYELRFPSVGATENLLCAAVLSEGETVLYNCATEPEVGALERLLIAMGGRIEGVDTPNLTINGVSSLHGAEFTVIPDRIVAATYISAAIASSGNITVTDCNPNHLRPFLNLMYPHMLVKEYSDAVTVTCDKRPQGYGRVFTAPYPFFPTDMQSLILALGACADGGKTTIRENLFESRLSHIADELIRMNADITVDGNVADIRGRGLFGAEVFAYDLRGGAALTVAGLSAEGITVVHNVENVCRGYLDLAGALSSLGGKIDFVP